MDIKGQLKQIDVKVSKLAAGLEISRPTFDSYLELYEKGEAIPNDKYQIIFEYLFSNGCVSAVEFAQRYDFVRSKMLNGIKDDVTKQKKDDRSSFLVSTIDACLKDPSISPETLEFLYLLLRNKDVEVVKLVEAYFNLANGIVDGPSESFSDQEKAFLSSMAILFTRFKDSGLTFDEAAYQNLLEQNKKMHAKRSLAASDDEVIAYIKTHISDVDSIDVNKLREMLAKSEGKGDSNGSK
jgi:hypothetical protein